MWLGVSIHSGDREFQVPDDYPLEAAGYRVDADGKKYIRVKGVRWFTNLDNKGRHENVVLYKKYSSKEYPKYDNYNAIEVSKVSEIPMDYDDIMGVPITFLDKYNPKQFEILGITDRDVDNKYRSKMYTRKDSPKYNDLNRRAAMKINREIIPVYARLLIRNKKPI